MKGPITLLVMTCIFSACAQTQEIKENHIMSTKSPIREASQQYSSILKQNIPDSSSVDFIPAYDKLKIRIAAKRSHFFQSYQQAATESEKQSILDSANAFLQEALVSNVFLFWYGTAWDFNGITEKPQHGYIACGYFVSTTLKHCGINLNRYKVAQQYSHSIVKTLCRDITIYTKVDQLIQAVKDQPNQLYLIGLDNHVGFIAKTDSGVAFVHSSYFGDAVVESECAADSEVLAMSNNYVLGNLSGNRSLMQQWLKGSPVIIVP